MTPEPAREAAPAARCEACVNPATACCGLDDQPMLRFCADCYATHVAEAHPEHREPAARPEAPALREAAEYAARAVIGKLLTGQLQRHEPNCSCCDCYHDRAMLALADEIAAALRAALNKEADRG